MSAAVPQTELETVPRPHRAISRIRVRDLHGKFNYDLRIAPLSTRQHAKPSTPVDSITEDRLTLLYGTNGTGKTSLLRLLFHALSSANDRGHRNALKRIRFREFRVTLTDSSYVLYTRDESSARGGFTAEARLGKNGEGVATDYWRDDKHSAQREELERMVYLQPGSTAEHADLQDIPLHPELKLWSYGESQHDVFIATLNAIGVNPVFLEDSRAITSDVLDQSDMRRLRAVRRRSARERGAEPEDDAPRRREVDVEEALERVRLYLSQLAFTGTQAGSLRVDNVYVSVAAAIIQHSSKIGRPRKHLLPELREKVQALNEQAARFHAYGLLPESPMLELAERLQAAEDKHGPLLTQVLTPHLEGFKGRLDALEPGLNAVAAFVDSLNAFLADKRVSFNPGPQGLRIIDQRTDEQIGPDDLSSGEKQIVLMFSDIIALQNETRLFLIDEPELSLNPDWQRSVMPSLLAVTKASEMQLIAATHSIEIMAKYRNRRRQLTE
jgi:ABC-type ATPase involved in cell division